MSNAAQPASNCPLCPRLAAFREVNRQQYPAYFNNPVPSFGDLGAGILIVGLAPGLKGANQTGRPFTGDYAGIILYSALLNAGLAKGDYQARPDDGLRLINCRITNAVRCVPPENKPEPSEIKTCNRFLANEIAAMPNLKVIVSLGGISHGAVLTALGQRKAAYKFGHAAEHRLAVGERKLVLLDTYHSSRYNINTGRVTQAMFDAVIAKAVTLV